MASLPDLERALRTAPADVSLLTQLGQAYRQLGRHDEAASSLVRAVSLAPESAAASFQLGLTLRALGESEAALACFTRAADVAPERLEHQLELGHQLRRAEDFARAIGHYQCALALQPATLEALIGLSYSLRSLERLDGACVISGRAIALFPSSPAGHYELGKALTNQGRYDAAIDAFEAALRFKPSHADAHFGVAFALAEVGRLSEAIAHFRASLQLRPADRVAHSNLLYMMLFDANSSADELLREARAWSKSYAEPLTPTTPSHDNSRQPERRLRVGYVAPTFRNHCQAFFLDPLLRSHDHESFEIFCYSSSAVDDDVTTRLKRYADVWRDVRALDDAALSDLVRADQIDILVDLNLHMADSRLCVFARRPAPLQLTWLGYPGTTGLSSIDYRISDPLLDPPGERREPYTERTLRLPDAFWCYDPLCQDLEVSELPALNRRQITFGCLNAFWKQNAAAFALWAQVLSAVPGSRLLLLAPSGGAERFVRKSFESHGIAGERIFCVPRQARREYLKTYQRIDICLDTIPYNGHTTSLDAFWMGVPVVTLVGDRVVGRAGLCQATLLGVPELIAYDAENFVDRARTLASDLPALTRLRADLRARLERSALMDASRFAKNLEQLYREAWRSWCEPAHH